MKSLTERMNSWGPKAKPALWDDAAMMFGLERRPDVIHTRAFADGTIGRITVAGDKPGNYNFFTKGMLKEGRVALAGGKGAFVGFLGKAAGKTLGAGLGMAFTAQAGIEGFKKSGVRGATWGMAKEAAVNALMFHGMKAVAGVGGWTSGTGFVAGAQGFALGAARLTVLNPFVAGPALALGTAAVAGYSTYKGAEASWQYHINKLPLEFTGSMESFMTSGAATMRQRSLQNIQRSHLNARSAFGSEAEYAHLARYRGVGRRGTM
jgi:hypothetical protein